MDNSSAVRKKLLVRKEGDKIYELVDQTMDFALSAQSNNNNLQNYMGLTAVTNSECEITPKVGGNQTRRKRGRDTCSFAVSKNIIAGDCAEGEHKNGCL